MPSMPIKIYKDKVEFSVPVTSLTTSNLTIEEEGKINGVIPSMIGAASQSELGALEDRVDLSSNAIETLQQDYTILKNKVILSSEDIATLQKDLDDTQIFVLESFTNGAIKLSKMSADENNNAVFTPYRVGNVNTPVYFEDGIPKQCSTSLAVSITGSSTSCTGNAATATTAETCSGNAATATKLNVTGTAQVNLAASNAPVYTNGGNISLGITGVLPATNGGTGVSSLYKEGAVTPASGTITSTSYVREYPFLKLVVFSIKLENASFSKGQAVPVAALSGVSGAPTNCGVSAYCSGSGTSQVISRAYMGGTNIYIYFNTDVSNKSIGISGAYITS